MSKAEKRKQKGIRELQRILKNDNLKICESDPESRGISSKGNLTLQFKGRKYSIEVENSESIPNSKLENAKDDTDILMFRKNRQGWKVYMNLNEFVLLLLNKRS